MHITPLLVVAALLGAGFLVGAALAFFLDRPGRGAAVRVPRHVDQDTVRLIRAAAERAAQRVAGGNRAAGRNPYRPGTREFVLWTTSFHSRLMEFEDDDTPAARGTAAA